MATTSRVFVQIASYRDPDLPRTVGSALATAAQPERLSFAICDQYDERTAGDLDVWQSDHRFRIDAVPYRDSRGSCWARARTGALYDGEPYTLQVDAHTRFAPGWDDRFIAMLGRIEADKALLTTYPRSFVHRDGEDVLDDSDRIDHLVLVELRDDLTTELRGEPAPRVDRPGDSHFIAGGLIFAPGRFVTEVPYDPGLYFVAQELSMAVRAFTHGYELRYPDENLVWHHYHHDAPLHWSDHGSNAASHRREIERLRTLLVGDATELGRFGLGSERTVADYEAYAGLDLAARLAQAGEDDEAMLRVRRFLSLDTSTIGPGDGHDRWRFALLDEDGSELFRCDLTDRRLLASHRPVIRLDVDVSGQPTHYRLAAKSSDGWGQAVVRQLPAGGD